MIYRKDGKPYSVTGSRQQFDDGLPEHDLFHIWDEEDPGLMQFDLYTCGKLNLPSVLLALGEEFKIISLDYNLFDREKGFVLEDSGHWPEEGSDYKI